MKLLVVCGPTATGKTKLAAYLAKKFNGELISADSRQVFVGNDLETNKERPPVPIWLYDAANQGQEFSVSHWVKLAKNAVEDINKRGKLPIVVGGSGLYIKSLIDPFSTIDIPPNIPLREKNLSVSQLQKLVPRENMNDSDWNNPRRLIRKIEITKFKRGPLASSQGDPLRKYDVLSIGITAPISDLYKRIDDHLKERIAAGMSQENITNEHAIARRQMTWFKKQKNILWFDIMDPMLIDKVTSVIMNWYEN